MDFEMYVRENNGDYKKILISPPSGAGWDFFKSLKMTVDKHLEEIRNDIVSYFDGKTKEQINLIAPKVEDKNMQEKIDKLVDIRKLNNKTKELLVQTLAENEFIVCDHCKGRMYKTPINVKYQKIGNRFLILDESPHANIKYHYACENCVFAISEENYNEMQDLKKLREELIAKGESYVPNEYGFWRWINYNNLNLPEFLKGEEPQSRKREFEFIKIPGERNAFVKITEVYPDGTVVQIK